MATVQSKMALGIVWMVAARLIDRGIGVISTLILARILVPDDFGLVAMATAIGGILDLLGAFSFDLALIQNKGAGKREYDTVWTFNVLFAIFCGICLIGLASPAAAFYREPRLEAVMYALAVLYAIGGLSNVGVVNFRKELQFRNEFNFILIRRVVTFIVTITGAFWLRSYWALVLGMIVGRATSVYVSYQMSSYRPRLTLVAVKELFHFSKWLFFNNSLFFLMHSGPNFFIGRLNGTADLGIYTVAYEISNLPSTELVAPINRATFPGFAMMGDKPSIAAAYLKLLGMITLLILPVGVGIAAVAEPLVMAALGDKWLAAIPLIQWLAIYGAVTATATNNGVVWMVLGRPRDVTLYTMIFLLIFLPALVYFLENHGVIGVAYAYLLAAAVNIPPSMANSRKLLEFRWSEFLKVIWRPIIGVMVMYAAVGIFDHLASSDFSPVLRLLGDSLFGALVYIIVIVGLWISAGRPSGAEAFCLERARKTLFS